MRRVTWFNLGLIGAMSYLALACGGDDEAVPGTSRAVGGAPSGGSSAAGTSPAEGGTALAGGGAATSGGTPPDTGGAPTGGATVTVGGTPPVTGGAPTGGATVTAGGTSTGGTTTTGGTQGITGGVPTGGAATGGAATGGVATGGSPAGGAAAGGADTGGAATGGTNSGGVSSGGASTGGTNGGGTAGGGASSGPVCNVVTTLPTMGQACTNASESQCDGSGGRCICQLGIWYCNTACASSYPTRPTPNTACQKGAACNYGDEGCACFNSRWMCIGGSGCPAAANKPMTGQDCNSQTGLTCDYPSTDPLSHLVCSCSANGDAGSGSAWTCAQSARCPATQSLLVGFCPGVAVCTYGSTYCACIQAGIPWVCV